LRGVLGVLPAGPMRRDVALGALPEADRPGRLEPLLGFLGAARGDRIGALVAQLAPDLRFFAVNRR
jgi:hypothetical protein